MYDLILLDLDDTLLDFQEVQVRALAAVVGHVEGEGALAGRSAASGCPTVPDALVERFRTINESLWRAFERHEVSKTTVFHSRWELFFGERGVPVDPAAANALFLATLAEEPVLLPGARELCETLAAHHPLAVVTNGDTRTQKQRLAAAGLAPFFRALAVSDEVAHGKPHRAIFDLAFSRAGVRHTAHGLMIGDSLAADVAGALARGLDACWLNPRALPRPSDLAPHFEIRALAEVLELPGIRKG